MGGWSVADVEPLGSSCALYTIRFPHGMRIYLTGFMGSGKSTVGPRVAARLGQPFLDLDRLIRAHDGRPIPQIFAEEGEAGFREKETAFLRKTAETQDLVVALGGGALVDADNRAFAKEHGRVVYLEVSPATVAERVGEEADQRPLLQDEEGTPLAGAALQTRIESMLDERRRSYEAAHATVDANASVEAVETAIVETVEERGWRTTPRFHDL
jgi:shikimate kinase